MHLELQESELPVHLRFGRPMEDDELLRFCAKNDAWRVEREANGELILMTPAGGGTGRKNAYLVHMLGAWSDADGRGYYFDSNTGFTLPDGSMRSPDAAWIEASRWDALSERDQERFSPIVPEFILELRSPSAPLSILNAKMQLWIDNGVELAWLIDPVEQAVTIYRPGAEPERLARPESIRGAGPVDGFDLSLSKIWA